MLASLPQAGLHKGFGAGGVDRSTTRDFPRSGQGPVSSLKFTLLLMIAVTYSFLNIPDSLPFYRLFYLITPLTNFSLFLRLSLILISFLELSLMAHYSQSILPFSMLSLSLGPVFSQPW